jgi:hypothetical protein
MEGNIASVGYVQYFTKQQVYEQGIFLHSKTCLHQKFLTLPIDITMHSEYTVSSVYIKREGGT